MEEDLFFEVDATLLHETKSLIEMRVGEKMGSTMMMINYLSTEKLVDPHFVATLYSFYASHLAVLSNVLLMTSFPCPYFYINAKQ